MPGEFAIQTHRNLSRTVFRLYLAVIFAFLIVLGSFYAYTRNDFAMGDWMINYAGGFVRRGITGAIALEAAKLHISPFYLLLVFQLALYGTIFACIWKLANRLEWRLWQIALIFSPATIAFPLHDPAFAFRKEILLFAVLASVLVILSRDRPPTGLLAVLLGLAIPFSVLSHEALLLFVPYVFAALWVGLGRIKAAILTILPGAITGCISFALASRYPGDAAASRTICAAAGGQQPGVGLCGGSIGYLANDKSYYHAEVIALLHSRAEVMHIVLVTVLAFAPICWAFAVLYKQPDLRSAIWRTIGCSLLAIGASVPLFVYAKDWTRWIYMHVFCLFLLLLFIQSRRKQEKSNLLDAPRSGARRWVGLLLLVPFVLGWSLSAAQPRIPFGGLVSFAKQRRVFSPSVMR